MDDASITRWLVAALAALAIVLLVAYSRNDPGVDDRDADPEDVVVVNDGD